MFLFIKLHLFLHNNYLINEMFNDCIAEKIKNKAFKKCIIVIILLILILLLVCSFDKWRIQFFEMSAKEIDAVNLKLLL